MIHLDRIDRSVLAALQNDARISNKELAARIGLAPSSCLARVKRLEAEGAIVRYRAELDADALGLGLQAMIAVQLRLHADQAFGDLGCHLRTLPETLALYCLGGAIDFLVHVACRDTEHLRVLTLRSFTSRPEVAKIETSLIFAHSRCELDVTAPEPPAIPARGARGGAGRPRPATRRAAVVAQRRPGSLRGRSGG